jgi:hypothetical protein
MSDFLNNAKESIQKNMPDTSGLTEGFSNAANSVRETAQNATADFSSEGVGDASQEFLNSNSMIAKFVFVILVVIVFLVLLNLGFNFVVWLTSPSTNPYLIHGMLSGTAYTVMPQDPASGTPVIYRSNNQASGAEFTWTIWLKVDQMPASDNYQCVFVKGTDQYNAAGDVGIATVNNGPGLYLKKSTGTSSQLVLRYVMDVVSPDSNGQRAPVVVDISNCPLGKWFHVAARLQNKTLDCYVNGVITNRTSFGEYIPKQNYDSIIYAGNGGFSGAASNLRYYSNALSVFELNSIVYYGPNLNAANGSSGSFFDYLGRSWYLGNTPQ